jgi:hypothetical protein
MGARARARARARAGILVQNTLKQSSHHHRAGLLPLIYPLQPPLLDGLLLLLGLFKCGMVPTLMKFQKSQEELSSSCPKRRACPGD